MLAWFPPSNLYLFQGTYRSKIERRPRTPRILKLKQAAWGDPYMSLAYKYIRPHLSIPLLVRETHKSSPASCSASLSATHTRIASDQRWRRRWPAGCCFSSPLLAFLPSPLPSTRWDPVHLQLAELDTCIVWLMWFFLAFGSSIRCWPRGVTSMTTMSTKWARSVSLYILVISFTTAQHSCHHSQIGRI